MATPCIKVILAGCLQQLHADLHSRIIVCWLHWTEWQVSCNKTRLQP